MRDETRVRSRRRMCPPQSKLLSISGWGLADDITRIRDSSLRFGSGVVVVRLYTSNRTGRRCDCFHLSAASSSRAGSQRRGLAWRWIKVNGDGRSFVPAARAVRLLPPIDDGMDPWTSTGDGSPGKFPGWLSAVIQI
jgi:hypothetical protein